MFGPFYSDVKIAITLRIHAGATNFASIITSQPVTAARSEQMNAVGNGCAFVSGRARLFL
jgi:hypothetical protein